MSDERIDSGEIAKVLSGPGATITAEDVLLVLNGMVPIDLRLLEFCVITDAPDGRGYAPFERGEIVVLTKNGGHEPFGEQRKPSKWDVGEEHCATLAEAMACRASVLAGTWPRSYA